MKKLLLLSAILVFACSSDDDNSVNNENPNINSDIDNILPTRQTKTYVDGSGNEILRVWDYNFANKKLISTTRTTSGFPEGIGRNRIETFTNIYDGELITRQITNIHFLDEFWEDRVNEDEYEYDANGRLIKETYICPPNSECPNAVKNYNYLNNGLTVQVTNIDGELIRLLNYDNNFNLIEVQYFDENGTISSVISYSFDDKNKYYKNAETWAAGVIYIGKNNWLTTDYSDNVDNNISGEYVFNEFDFPVSAELTRSDGRIYYYTYEYNN